MRYLLLASVLLILGAGVATAGDDVPRTDRVARLQHELTALRLEADMRKALNVHLFSLIDDLFARLRESPAAERKDLQAALQGEQERHTAGVAALHRQLALAMQACEEHRRVATRAEQKTALLQQEVTGALARLQTQKSLLQQSRAKAKAEAERRIALSKELDRLKWNLQRGAPKDGVAARLGGVPAAHWRRELTSKDAMPARVALAVLAVVPDPSPETVDLILHAAGHHRELLDRATGALVPLGASAVEKLVAAARARAVPPAWAMNVLAEIGPDANEALPWLGEVAEGEGRDADAARRAIDRIR